MPTFIYKAKISPMRLPKVSSKRKTAPAVTNLLNQGYFPIYVKDEPEQFGEKFLAFKKTSGRDLYVFSHQLAVLINSGLDLLSSLNTIISQTHNGILKGWCGVEGQSQGRQFVVSGDVRFSEIFSPFYTAMVRSAETGGNLEETLNRLAEYCAKDQELKANIKQALAYPIFVA